MVILADFVIYAVAAAWIVTQIFTLWAAKYVIQKSRDEAQSEKNEIRGHFDEKLSVLEAKLPTNGSVDVEARIEEFRVQLEDFRSDFSGFAGQLGEDLEKLPKTLAYNMMTERGMETKAVQAYLDQAGGDLEEAGSMMEAYAAQDPELMVATAMKKVAEWKPSKKYGQEHPLIVAALEIGKPALLNQLSGMMLGTSTKSQSPGGRNALPSPYGR